jgi:hypothetical protein
METMMLLLTWMMLAPVYVTTPAISMEYQRAPLRITYLEQQQV